MLILGLDQSARGIVRYAPVLFCIGPEQTERWWRENERKRERGWREGEGESTFRGCWRATEVGASLPSLVEAGRGQREGEERRGEETTRGFQRVGEVATPLPRPVENIFNLHGLSLIL